MGVRRVLFLDGASSREQTASRPDSVLIPDLARRGFDCHRIESGDAEGGASDAWLGRLRPDIVVADGSGSPVVEVFERAHRLGAATVLILRDGSLRDARHLAECDRVVVHSQFLADYYRGSLGIACDVLPIPVGAAPRAGTGPDPSEAERRRYITFVDPTPGAGVFALARIADELGRRRPDIPFLVVEGRGTEADLASCGIDLRPRGNVHVMGCPPDPEAYCEVTRVALVPAAEWDAPGVEAARAVARGLRVVASDRGALPEIVAGRGTTLPLPGWLTHAARAIPSPGEVAPWVDALIRSWDGPGPDQAAVIGDPGESYARFLRGLRPGAGIPRATDDARSRWVVLVPFLSSIEYDCEFSLRRLEDSGVRVVRCRGSSAIDMARNKLASEALHRGCESILFIDADIAFDPGDALRLLARPEPVLAGVYPKKGPRELACAFAPGVDAVTFGPDAPGLYPLDYAAAGFLRIRAEALRSMIETLGLPLCNRNEGGGIWPFFLPIIIPGEDPRYLGEDWAFSHRLRQVGITPMADTSFRLFHIGAYGYSWEEAGEPANRYGGYTIRIANPDPVPGADPTAREMGTGASDS